LITIRRLTECPLQDAVEAWNKGFEDYFIKLAFTTEQFVGRMAAEGLSPERSVLAYADGKPVGILVNGIREGRNGREAWNGGTAVAADYRKQGVGRAMLEASLRIYSEEKVDTAWLEAIGENAKAIRLYEALGYCVADRLLILERKGPGSEAGQEGRGPSEGFHFQTRRPHEAPKLDFYRHTAAWQNQWQSCREGELLLALDGEGRTVGYSLLRRGFDASGNQTGATLMQCAASPEQPDRRPILEAMLQSIFGSALPSGVQQRAFNLSLTSDKELIQTLQGMGFEPASEQVRMSRKVVPHA